MNYELNAVEREVLRVISEWPSSEMAQMDIPLMCSPDYSTPAIHAALWDLVYAKLLTERQLYFALTDEGKAALSSNGATSDEVSLVLNFSGQPDAQCIETIDALKEQIKSGTARRL